MGKTLSITVDTTDDRTLGIVGHMFLKLAGGGAAVTVAEAKTNEALDTAAALAAAEAPSIDTAAALAAAHDGDYTPEQVAAPEQPIAPPIPAAAPAPPVAPHAPAGVELDSKNLPWDARIHTSNKAKTQTGTWKMKKGLPDGEYDRVVAELKGTMAAPAAPPTHPAPLAPAGVAPAPAAPAPAPAPAAPAPAAPQAPAPAPAAPAPAAPQTPTDTPTTYPQLLAIVGRHMAAQKISASECTFACQQHGIEGLTLLVNRPDLVPAVYESLAAIWSGR